jgi:hypothetical protein
MQVPAVQSGIGTRMTKAQVAQPGDIIVSGLREDRAVRTEASANNSLV